MELKILEEKEKILLSRKEIKVEVKFTEAVPSKEELKKAVATQLKADGKLIVIKNVFPKFKSNKADVLAYHYISEEDMKKIEVKDKKKKEKKKPAEGGEAPKAEAPKAAAEEKKEAPKEEKKEEPKEGK